MIEQFYLPGVPAKSLEKARRTEDEDGVLTEYGMEIAHDYARGFLGGRPRKDLEEDHPELRGLFYDIRHDPSLAREHAIPLGKSLSQSLDESELIGGIDHDPRQMTLIYVLPFEKALSGPFYGPRGGKWADPKMTIPWSEAMGRRKRKEAVKKTKEQRKERLGISELREWRPHYKDKAYNEAMGTVSEYRLRKGGPGEPPVYKPERERLHDKWMSEFLTDKEGKPIKAPPKTVQKVAIVMMGGPASGKTSTVKHLLGTSDFASKGFANVNPDDVKEMMPEYNEALSLSAKDAAWIAHAESSDVASKVYNEALNQGLNIILDGTGKNLEKYSRKIQALKDRGYHVQLVMPDVDIQDARQRSSDRAQKIGRYVPDEILIPAHQKIPGNFEPLARMCDQFYLYDTRGGKPPPALKWQGGTGQADIIHDEAWVGKFQNRARRLSGQRAQAQEKEMSKAFQKIKKPLAFDIGTEGKRNMEATKDRMWEDEKYGTEIKYPEAGKNGNGAIAVVEDVDYSIWAKSPESNT